MSNDKTIQIVRWKNVLNVQIKTEHQNSDYFNIYLQIFGTYFNVCSGVSKLTLIIYNGLSDMIDTHYLITLETILTLESSWISSTPKATLEFARDKICVNSKRYNDHIGVQKEMTRRGDYPPLGPRFGIGAPSYPLKKCPHATL